MQKAGKPSFKGVGAYQVLLIFVQPIKTTLLEQLNFIKILFLRPILQILEVLMACLAQMSLVNDCEVDSKIG